MYPQRDGSAVYRFQTPPNWPATPPGWTPPPGWRPDPAWGPVPPGWSFWVVDELGQGRVAEAVPPTAPPVHQPTPPVSSHVDTDIGVIGARSRARELASKVNHLVDENTYLRGTLDRLGVMEAVELEGHRDRLKAEISGLEGERERGRARIEADLRESAEEGARQLKSAKAALEDEIAGLDKEKERRRARIEADLRTSTEQVTRGLERSKAALEKEIAGLKAEERRQRALADSETKRMKGRLDELRARVVVSEDLAVLQEAGVYEYSHPLDDSVAYRAALAKLKDRTKTMNRKDGGAVEATTSFTMNGSATEGRKMVGEFSKLLLRAYNNEADNLVRGMKPYKLSTSRDRLTKSRATIEKLGRSMDIRIANTYHRLRLRELELTADHLNKVAQEKEREREEKARLREERQAQAELDRERARLDKERQHYVNALAALRGKGDDEGAQRLQEQIDDVGLAMENVEQRAANVRAGYVYVISNLGSFGERMVKVGMTRRLDPMDRVRELSDASVPFNFDVHALHFSDDAVGVEAEMHRRLADQRVNRVNLRREFFFASPAEVRELLSSVAGDLLQYEETPEAAEYRQSTGAVAEEYA